MCPLHHHFNLPIILYCYNYIIETAFLCADAAEKLEGESFQKFLEGQEQ